MLCGELAACSKSCWWQWGGLGPSLATATTEHWSSFWSQSLKYSLKYGMLVTFTITNTFKVCLFWRVSGCSFCTTSVWLERSPWNPGCCPLKVWGFMLKCPEIFTPQGTRQTQVWQLDHHGLVVCPFKTRSEGSAPSHPSAGGGSAGKTTVISWTGLWPEHWD